ncbi:Crp/Fnr family transcriptional regulator [Methylorubrum salsuginis]|uniref:cAMP-binding domain of CRP or a regulatory subunit of cAMP-dependent protein kinases n=1 Tax=Methylorubrum salsuginis TaxID=414703 RepID=A0A1I4M7A8_9HYPH|nr:Crp/Fnr family transcriptional regulator [Methylorubrum salsuginis]SFL99151.1 cAMP-binding domain of CRP or a regulatory subunit of cAMP-dependent protein kinases [Methylorubrum salsuginis]
MPRPHPSGPRNRLLAALTAEDFARLGPHLEPVTLEIRQILVSADRPITHAVFFEEGLASLIADTGEGRVEVGLVGYEGMIGVPLLLGTDRTPHTGMVQAEGTALRIEAAALSAALEASARLRRVLGRYVQSLIVQVGQTVYANADQTIEGRLARWILMTQDRLCRDELPLTHEFMATMLGVRRPGVTTALHILEGAGLVRARRGRVTVLDREGLTECAGGGYGPAEAEYERLIGEG